MGLEDKIYPEGGLLTKFDNFMIKKVGKLGEFYQNLTGKSYKNLVKEMHQSSLYLAGTAIGCLNVYILPFGLLSLEKFKDKNFFTSIEEENYYELKHGDKHDGKKERLIFLLGSFILPAIEVLNMNIMNDNSILDSVMDFGFFVAAPVPALLTLAEYLRLSKPPEPPKKKVPVLYKQSQPINLD